MKRLLNYMLIEYIDYILKWMINEFDIQMNIIEQNNSQIDAGNVFEKYIFEDRSLLNFKIENKALPLIDEKYEKFWYSNARNAYLFSIYEMFTNITTVEDFEIGLHEMAKL